MTKLLTQRISFTMNFYRFFKTIWNIKICIPPLVTPLHKNAPTPTRQTRLLGIPKTHRTYPGSMGHGNFNYQNGLGTRTIRNNLLKTLNLYFAQLSTAGLIIKNALTGLKWGTQLWLLVPVFWQISHVALFLISEGPSKTVVSQVLGHPYLERKLN